MTFRFDEATRVDANHDGTFSARVHDGWDIGGNANGGYLLALVSAAMCKATDRSLPVAISCHYLGPVNDADVVIETRVVKTGKTFATAHATMRQGERVVVAAIGTCGNALPGGATRHVTQARPSPRRTPRFDTASAWSWRQSVPVATRYRVARLGTSRRRCRTCPTSRRPFRAARRVRVPARVPCRPD